MTEGRISPFKLGLFVLLGLGLGIMTLLFVGIIGPFEARQTYVSFFDSPVEGLERGAPVRYLGIEVGEVGAIDLAPGDRMVRVLVNIRKDFTMDDAMYLQVSQKLVAGLTNLTLGRTQDAAAVARPELPFEPEYPVLPSRPSDMDRLLETARRVAGEVGDADFDAIGELTHGWSQAGNRLDDLLADPDLQQTLENVREASADLKAILQALGDEEAPGDWRKTRRDLSATATELRRASEALAARLGEVPSGALADISGGLEGMTAAGEEAVRSWDAQIGQSTSQLQRTLQQVESLITELERLTRSLRREPGQILERRKEQDPFAR
ncbi:MlaD family protein [Thiohalomonas denitrificans]|uniref:ABC-type transporter Mla maintaining outer membrane lipid asymmetry, component MlaD n=1 Tax=Thiohalomonas denitrificans TaxID=415747 RepID=A0A1G5PJB8_9GAMM|nr:MlaD family protein [Thiohalomonas denitrificans]SCZ49605.1 ABC-type transporter Mla maintaining outer membrane lipid asymmetry, component MlaD [Thiohalomonas denitrificans]